MTKQEEAAPASTGQRIGRGQRPLPLKGSVADIRQSLKGKRIWLWHYLHADWQWEQSREWHEERYALAVEEVLDLMNGDSGITYFFDTASEFWEPVSRHLGPRMEELKDRVREGRIRIVSGQVANARPNQVGEETYIRNLQLGREFFLTTLPIDDISLFHSVDIAIGHSQMPQILNLGRFSAYRAWRPHGPMNASGIPHQFVWEGLDGSSIVVTRGAYGGFYFGEMVPFTFETDWDSAVVTFHQHVLADQLLPERSNSNHLWAIQGSDDSRPFRIWPADRYFDLPKFVDTWNEREDVPIQWCTPDEYAAAVAEHRDDLPVIRGMIDGCDCSYNAGNSGRAGLWSWRTMNDRRLLRAERWAAVATQLGEPDLSGEFSALWWQHCIYQSHAEEFAFVDDFNHLVDLANEVRIRADRIEQTSLRAIALAVGGDTRLSRTIFNPNAWPIESDVEIYHAPAIAGIEGISFLSPNGAKFEAQTIDQFRHPRYGGSINDQRTLVRMAIPAFGYQKVEIVESTETPEAAHTSEMPTGDIQVSVKEHQLSSISHMLSGRSLHTNEGIPPIVLTFHELDDQNWLSMGPVTAEHVFNPRTSSWTEQGPLRWRFQTVGDVGPFEACMQFSIPDHGDEIRVDIRLEGHWNEPPMTGWVSLSIPCAEDAPITVDVPYGIESRDPDKDVYAGKVPEDRDYGLVEMFERLRPGWFWARSWVDANDANGGVAITQVDGTAYWQKLGSRIGPVLVRAQKRTPDTWEARTSVSMSGTGIHEYAAVIRLHDEPSPIVGLQRRSAELHHPPTVVRGNYPTQSQAPARQSFISVEGPAQVSAIYNHQDALIVRAWENSGTGGQVDLKLDREIATASLIDLTWVELDHPVTIEGSTVSTRLNPWQIATFKIETITS